MDSNLLCDEVWLSPPNATLHSSLYTATEDGGELAFCMFLEKEDTYMPNHGFSHYLHSENLVLCRLNAIQWLIKCCSRLDLSMATLFNAVNYLDRFISVKHCNEWKNWMMELLAVACLSVASKFVETSLPSIYEIQMEGLNHTFKSITIQQMELILLDTLEWKLSSTTPHSFIELVMTIQSDNFIKCTLQKELFLDRVTQLLLASILDYRMVEYRPSITAIAAIWCALEEIVPSEPNGCLTEITSLFDKEEIEKCRNMIKEQEGYKCPTSPVTVLLGVCDASIDLSIFNIQSHHVPSNKKIRRIA